MIKHRMLLEMTWRLVTKHGVDGTCDILGDVLPLLFVADARNKTYIAWTSRWWVKKIAQCGANSFEELLNNNPKLLDQALGAREGWTEEEANKSL
jgi:hypothetical protein